MKRILVGVLVLVAAACNGGGDTGGGDQTPAGSTGPSSTSAGSASTTTPQNDEVVRVQSAFCQDYLPLLAFTVDVGLVTGGDAIGRRNEADVLSLVEASSTILRRTETLMRIYADSLAELGEEGASDAAGGTAAHAHDIVHAADGQAVAAAIDPATINAVLPTDYCQPFVSQGFGRGYFDGWLLRPKDSNDPEYLRGYRLGRDEGWRADA